MTIVPVNEFELNALDYSQHLENKKRDMIQSLKGMEENLLNYADYQAMVARNIANREYSRIYLQNHPNSMGLKRALRRLRKSITRELRKIGRAIDRIQRNVRDRIKMFVNGMINIVEGLVKVAIGLVMFDENMIKSGFSRIGKGVGRIVIAANPITLTLDIMRSHPQLANLAKNIDRYTGGMLTAAEWFTNLVPRFLTGETIHREEWLAWAGLGIQIALIALSGGAAAVAGGVGMTAGFMRNGPLGRTSFGRRMLDIFHVAGLAYAGGTVVMDAVSAFAGEQLMAAGLSEAQNLLGVDSQLEVFLFNIAAAGSIAYFVGGQDMDSAQIVATETAKQQARDAAKGEVTQELSRHLPSSIAKGLAGPIVQGSEDLDYSRFDITEVDFSQIGSGYSFDQFSDDVSKMGGRIYDSFGRTIADIPSLDEIARASQDLAENIIKEAARTPENIVELAKDGAVYVADKISEIELTNYPRAEALNVPELSLPNFRIPDISMPDGERVLKDGWRNIRNLGLFYFDRMALFRREHKHGGKIYTIYLLDGGYYYYVYRTDYTMYALLGLGALAATQI